MPTTIITDQPNRHEYVAVAAQTDFAFDFQIFNGVPDIIVTKNGVAASFSVILTGAEGGTVRLVTPCVGGETIIIQRALQQERASQFADAGPLVRSTLNHELNRIVGLIQDVDQLVDRSIAYTDADVLDAVEASLVAAGDLTINRVGDTITITNLISPEVIRDTIASFIVAGTAMQVTHNDAGDTLTISSTAGSGTTPGLNLEEVQDAVSAMLVSGTGISMIYNDAGGTLTIESTGGYTDEQVRDVVGAFAVGGPGITVVHNDGANTLTIAIDPTLTLSFPVMASAMIPDAAAPPIASVVQLGGGSALMLSSLEFGPSALQVAHFMVPMPTSWDGWNGGTLKFEVEWTAAAGAGDVVWQMDCAAISDDDTLATACGAAVAVVDTFITANDLHKADISGPMTPSGPPGVRDLVAFRIYRNPAHVQDTFSGTARLIGLKIYYGVNNLDDL